MTTMVCGFLFDADSVLLIKKRRPSWQIGRLNGVGGRVEPGESIDDAMSREFREETGLDIDPLRWAHLGAILFDKGTIHFFRARMQSSVLDRAESKTDERVVRVPLCSFHEENLIPNLHWLIPLAWSQPFYPNGFTIWEEGSITCQENPFAKHGS